MAALLSPGLTPARAADTPQSLYEAARKEGTLIYWSSEDASMNRAIAADFARKYPGLSVTVFKIEPGPAVERIVTEASAGKTSLDVVDTPLSYVQNLLDRNLVDPYPWQDVFGLEPSRVLFGSRMVAFYELDMPIVVNTGLVDPGQIKGWDDLIDPKYRGKILIESRGLPFPLLAEAWGEDRTYGFLRKLLANKPVIIQGGTPTMEAVAGGQGAIAIGTYGGRALEYKANGAPVDWLRVGPIPALRYVAAPVRNAAHPNAARLWTAFLLSPEAQAEAWKFQNFGMLTGDTPDELGKEMQAAHLQLALESEDTGVMRGRLKQVGDIIKAGQ